MLAPTGHPRRRRRRPAVASLTALTLVTILLATAAPPARAHTELVGSEPAAGARASGPPTEVTLTFGEDVDPSLSAVSLEVDGRPLGRLRASAGDEPGTIVASVPVSDLGIEVEDRSSWTVGYRVTSVDGHPIAGTLDFTVSPAPSTAPTPRAPATSGAAPTPADGATSSTAPAPAEETSSTTRGDDGSNQTWWVPLMVVLLILLGAVAALRVGRSTSGDDEVDPAPAPPGPTDTSP